MEELKEKLVFAFKVVCTVIGLALVPVLYYGLSWIIVCGIIKLITICFSIPFKWSIATGIWLILCLLRAVFKED